MKNLFILFLAFVSFRQVMAQEDDTKFQPVNLAAIAEVNQVNNYIKDGFFLLKCTIIKFVLKKRLKSCI
ncbi:MAG: hypothetical protein KKB74_02605 [Bacteroidetes bacterium]|nr:hypothetical protein [Bacteroidota bacterium]